MEGTRDSFEYELAEALGWQSVEAMRQGMGYGEYLQWRAFNVWRNEHMKQAQEKAKLEAKRG